MRTCVFTFKFQMYLPVKSRSCLCILPPLNPTLLPDLLTRTSQVLTRTLLGWSSDKHIWQATLRETCKSSSIRIRDKHIIKLTSWQLTLIRLVLLSHDIIDKGGASHCGNLVIVGSQLWSQSCEGGTASLPLGCHRGCHRVPLACHWGATGFSMDLLREQQAMHWASTERVT